MIYQCCSRAKLSFNLQTGINLKLIQTQSMCLSKHLQTIALEKGLELHSLNFVNG